MIKTELRGGGGGGSSIGCIQQEEGKRASRILISAKCLNWKPVLEMNGGKGNEKSCVVVCLFLN